MPRDSREFRHHTSSREAAVAFVILSKATRPGSAAALTGMVGAPARSRPNSCLTRITRAAKQAELDGIGSPVSTASARTAGRPRFGGIEELSCSGARRRVLLADRTEVGTISVHRYGVVGDSDVLITDLGPDADIEVAGAEVVRVRSSGSDLGERSAAGRRSGGRVRVPMRAIALFASLLLTASCAGAGALGSGDGRRAVRVAVVSNPQMEDMQQLAAEFEREHPQLRLRFVTLPENQARDKITQSVATESGQFDVVMVSNYETPIWAANGWLTDLEPYIERTAGYDRADILEPVRDGLSYQDRMHAAPFYGEASLLMYREDLFEQAGVAMPARPTWQQVAELAAELDDDAAGRSGICLRGLPGWGQVMAPLNTVINAFGGRWFDPQWRAQLTSPRVREAVSFYVDLVRRHGQPGAASSGFTECLTRFSQGNSAMMYDASAGAGTIENPAESNVAGDVGYAPAPRGPAGQSSWLYSWALAIPKTTERPEDAWEFISWATSKEYVRTVGERIGWENLPPGTRRSTYELAEYQRAAGAFAEPTLSAIRSADQNHPTALPAPYVGLQFLRIPEFVDLGTLVSQQMSAAVAGGKTVDEALRQSQRYAQTVGESYQR